jgi:hypothetical protein
MPLSEYIRLSRDKPSPYIPPDGRGLSLTGRRDSLDHTGYPAAFSLTRATKDRL